MMGSQAPLQWPPLEVRVWSMLYAARKGREGLLISEALQYRPRNP